MRATKTDADPRAAAWRQFNRVARQLRDAHEDQELATLLAVRTRGAFETWLAAEAGEVK